MKDKYFILYQDCFIVKGAKNILMCDLYRNKVMNITDIYSFFKKEKFILNDSTIYTEVIEVLIVEEFGYLSDNIDNIDVKKIVWNTPNLINEVIIEHSRLDNFDLKEIYSTIDSIGTVFLQIRFLEFSFEKLKKIMAILIVSGIKTIEILIPYFENILNNKIIAFLRKQKRVQIIYFYNAPFNKSIQDDKNLFNIIYYKKNLTNVKYCGIIEEDYFLTDLKNFSKSKKTNNCLKDKLFISDKGEIKNCPSMENTKLNVKGLTLEDLIRSMGLDKYRNITKDHIEVCKDCEFRYMCTDCRAYTERTHINEDGLDVSKPLKCGYNPYIGEWSEWSTNVLKQKAIKYYGIYEII